MLTYNSNHSFLIGSEDDDPAVLTDSYDFWTAAGDAGAGGVIAGVTVGSRPLLRNWHGLRLKWGAKHGNEHQKCYSFHISVTSNDCLIADNVGLLYCDKLYLTVLVVAEDGHRPRRWYRDNSLLVQKLEESWR